MSNVLTRQQILVLGRLGWTLSPIQQTTGVRRQTVSVYLKAVGLPVRGRGRPSELRQNRQFPHGRCPPTLGSQIRRFRSRCPTDSDSTNAATRTEVSTDVGAIPRPGRTPSASACEPYRELIIEALRRGRNAMAIWQDLVDDHRFAGRYASVRRFVLTLRGTSTPDGQSFPPASTYAKS